MHLFQEHKKRVQLTLRRRPRSEIIKIPQILGSPLLQLDILFG